MDETPHYYALALQTPCNVVNALDTQAARASMAGRIDGLRREIASSKAFIGPDLRLVVLGEYTLTGFPAGESIAEWREKACLQFDGPEYQQLGKLCQDLGVYLAGNAYEVDPAFPDIYFQTCYLISDAGEVVLRYRRLVSMYSPSPHDVLDAYLDRYGADALFPVAQTPLGRIGGIASEEILYPEIARALALRGAEVLFNCTSEVAAQDTVKQAARRVRAVENLVYVIGANSGGYLGGGIPAQSVDGNSDIINHRGEVLVRAGYGPSMVAFAEIDLAALRRHRRRPGLPNTLSRQRLELFAGQYQGSVYPSNTWLDDSGQVSLLSPQDFRRIQQGVIEDLEKRGVI